MKLIALTLTFYLILSGCGGPQSSGSLTTGSTDRDSVSETVVAKKTQSCYLHIKGRDSVHLKLVSDGDSLQGTLYFNNYQIDDSRGSVRGRFHGDTLLVVYAFMAEGTDNLAEEAFLKKGDSLIRGFGDRRLVNEMLSYRKSEDIRFEEGQVFLPVPCP